MNWLQSLFDAIKALMEFAKGVTPSAKTMEDNHAIKRERLVLRERDRILEACRLWLSVRPKISIDSYVDFKCDTLNPLDVEEIKFMLHEMFPRRQERTLKYDKILHDTIQSINDKK